MSLPPDAAEPEVQPFAIKDCALIALATGIRVTLMEQLRRELRDIDLASIYHHFWGSLLQPRFEERELGNDFAAWARHGVHDAVLAERLAALDPVHFRDLEALRTEILELIDARLDEADYLAWARATSHFEFVSSEIVVFDTRRRLDHPAQLPEAIRQLSTSSVFYHFIDARRRRDDGHDDFSGWLTTFDHDYAPLLEELASVDPFFGSLSELKARLTRVFSSSPRSAPPWT